MRMRKKAWARPELEKCSYFIQQPTSQRGKWNEWFSQQAPIYLELGCGKGSFLAQMASANLGINFIAVDIKDDMLGYARRKLQQIYNEKEINNVALVPYDIERIKDIFSQKDTVDRIYINFCNPWPRPRHHKKRLTHTRQLEKYKEFLKIGGEIFFKTDDSNLYKDSLQYFKQAGYNIIKKTDNLDRQDSNIETEHEIMFREIGIPIKQIIAKRN